MSGQCSDCGCGCRMDGCGGRLCRACMRILKRFTVTRYPADSFGMPQLSAQPDTFEVCGFTASASSKSSSVGLDIPGRKGGGSSGLRLTVVASSGGEMKKHDRVTADGTEYRVTVVKSGSPAVAVLVEA